VIHVYTFARYREKLGFTHLEIEMPPDGTLADLLKDHRLVEVPKNALFAINQRFSGLNTKLNQGDEIAIMPPVSGG
jgi:molybdopterin converting factor small subunit